MHTKEEVEYQSIFETDRLGRLLDNLIIEMQAWFDRCRCQSLIRDKTDKVKSEYITSIVNCLNRQNVQTSDRFNQYQHKFKRRIQAVPGNDKFFNQNIILRISF